MVTLVSDYGEGKFAAASMYSSYPAKCSEERQSLSPVEVLEIPLSPRCIRSSTLVSSIVSIGKPLKLYTTTQSQVVQSLLCSVNAALLHIPRSFGS